MKRSAILMAMLAGCGGAAASTETSEPVPQAEAEPAAPEVVVRAAPEANLASLDPAIEAAMREAVQALYTTEQAAQMRVEAVVHELAPDDANQLRGRVRVTLVRRADERICTVLEGAAQAPQSADPELPVRVMQASMRAAMRNFETAMTDCIESSAP